MKISIITVCLNSAATIEDTVKSVICQEHKDIEYLIIDGGSTDGTLEIINRYRDKISRIISEPDNGIYDAMNKGICLAAGEVVGCLNADDIYTRNDALSLIRNVFETKDADAVYGDIIYVDKNNTDKIKRYWKSGSYKPGEFAKGWVPPHPAFFCRKEIYIKYGCFRKDMHIAADFELMMRFLEKYKIKVQYLPESIVKMRTGGRANVLQGMIRGNLEIIRSFKINDLHISPFFFISKPLTKISQIFKRPSV
ncbi:MAG TPA: glycosyltransferase family 2 protein [Sedimentisphaerales bacterium]|nr:glycosyltransferase family 2 protein [Sedimentisphaerales bacterium]